MHHPQGPSNIPLNPDQRGLAQAVAADYAKQGAQYAGEYAQQYATEGLSAMNQYIQEGPDGLKVLCFIGGAATTVTGCLGLLNVFSTLLHPIQYLVNGYQTVFGLMTMLIEANPQWAVLQNRVHFQRNLYEYAKFLTLLWGRGIFYIFQGSLALMDFSLLYIIIGLYMITLGGLCIAMYFGYKPDLKQAQQQVAGGINRFQGPPGQQAYARV